MNISKTLVSQLSEEKRRMIFSIRNNNVEWNNVILTGVKEIGGITMLCAISQQVREHCTLRVVGGRLHRLQYISFLDQIVLPIWNFNNNFIFVQVNNFNIQIFILRVLSDSVSQN